MDQEKQSKQAEIGSSFPQHFSTRLESPFQVETFSQLQVLLNNSPGSDRNVAERLNLLVKIVKESDATLFVQPASDGMWLVVAPSIESVIAHTPEIKSIDELQRTIDGKRSYGMCLYVHEYALATGIANRLLINGEPGSEQGIFTTSGRHVIAERYDANHETSIFFDLTAKSYIFQGGFGNVYEPLASGLIIIASSHRPALVEALYGTSWNEFPVRREQLDTPANYLRQFGYR